MRFARSLLALEPHLSRSRRHHHISPPYHHRHHQDYLPHRQHCDHCIAVSAIIIVNLGPCLTIHPIYLEHPDFVTSTRTSSPEVQNYALQRCTSLATTRSTTNGWGWTVCVLRPLCPSKRRTGAKVEETIANFARLCLSLCCRFHHVSFCKEVSKAGRACAAKQELTSSELCLTRGK